MHPYRHKFANTLLHLPIDAKPHPVPALVLNLLGLMQLVAAVTHPRAYLHQGTSWTDPNVYISSSFAVGAGTLLTLAYLLLLTVRIGLAEGDETLVRPGMCVRYVAVLVTYLRVICETVVIGPLLIGCLSQFKEPTNSVFFGLAVVGFICYFAVVYPLSLYLGLDRSVVTENEEKKIVLLNVELVFNIYKVVMVATGVLSQEWAQIMVPLFFILFVILVLRAPFFCFNGQTFKRGVISAVALICLIRGINAMFGRPEGALLLELIAVGGFIGLVEWVSVWRLRRVLGGERSVYQLKVLTFLVVNLDDYLSYLQEFILRHHKECRQTDCRCQSVVLFLSSKETDLKDHRIWFQFLAEYLQADYQLAVLEGLAVSELNAKTEEYGEFVFDIAEIELLRLGRVNRSYLLVSSYRHHLSSHQLSHLLDQRRYRLFLYYLHRCLSDSIQGSEVFSVPADKYVSFQVEFTRYLKLLSRSAHRTRLFWEELAKRDPHEPTLVGAIRTIQKWNSRIRQIYRQMANRYPDSTLLTDPLTLTYFSKVLNIPQNDPLHLIQPEPVESADRLQARERGKRMDEATRIFSEDSETALCFVSVEQSSWGAINFGNCFFERWINRPINNMVQMVPPELRGGHESDMKELVAGDVLSVERPNSCVLLGENKIVMVRTLLQVVPSIWQGLRYALLFKEIGESERVCCVSSEGAVLYLSEGFESLVEVKLGWGEVKRKLTGELVEEVVERGSVDWEIEEGEQLKISLLGRYETGGSFVALLSLSGAEDELQTRYMMEEGQFRPEKQNEDNLPLSELTNGAARTEGGLKKREFGRGEGLKEEEVGDERMERERKVEEKVRKTFGYTLGEAGERRVVSVAFWCLFLSVCLVIVLLVTLMALKSVNRDHYEGVSRNYEEYHRLIMVISETATNLERLNFAANGVGNTSELLQLYQKMRNGSSINVAMDNYVSYFRVEEIGQVWRTLNLVANGSFLPLSESYFMAVFDFLQGPLNNLAQSYNVTSFNFPIAYDLLTPPLSTIEQQFHTFITNALYFALPNFRSLKRGVIDPILNRLLDNSFPSLLVSLFLIPCMGLVVLVLLCLNRRVLHINGQACRFLEQLNGKELQQKQEGCRQFCRLHEVSLEQEKSQKENVLIKTGEKETTAVFANISRNLSKAFSEYTERELDFTNTDPFGEKSQQTKVGQEQSVKRRKTRVFSEESCWGLVWKLMVVAVPVVIVGVVFGVMAKEEAKRLGQVIALQDEVTFMEREVSLIRLYSLHYGVYSASLEGERSIPLTLRGHIEEMFLLLQLKIQNLEAGYAPRTQQFLAKMGGDLCVAEKMGAFRGVHYDFPGRGNLGQCEGVSGGILKKGYLAALLHYLEWGKRNMQENGGVVNYTAGEKRTYLSSGFNGESGLLVDYFILVGERVLLEVRDDLRDCMEWHSRFLTVTAVVLIIFLVAVLVVREVLLRHYTTPIRQVTAIYSLISCKTILAHETLRNQFLLHSEELASLK